MREDDVSSYVYGEYSRTPPRSDKPSHDPHDQHLALCRCIAAIPLETPNLSIIQPDMSHPERLLGTA